MDDIGRFILEKLEKLDDKVDDIQAQGVETKTRLEAQANAIEKTASNLSTMGEKMGDYNEQLGIHIKRSEMLEDQHNKYVARLKPILDEHIDGKAVRKHSAAVWAARIKIMTGISLGLTILAGTIKLISLI